MLACIADCGASHADMWSAVQVASFERNPMTGLPNYRQKVLQLLPNLENLDGQVGRCT